MSREVGSKLWVVALGHIPLESRGPEPECTSHDKLAILNATEREANVEIEIFYADRDAVGPYRLRVDPRRLRVVRYNDLIDPLPIPLDVDYAAIVRADRPVVVQCLRFETAARGTSIALPTVSLE